MEKFQKPALSGVLKHNARVWEGRGFTREHIDNSKLSLDWCPGIERDDPEGFVASRIESLNLKRKPRENAVRMVEWVCTLPEGETDQKAFFRAAYKALAKEYGEQNVIGAWVHCDEPGARPHMHFDFVPVTQDGRLSAKSLMDRSHLKQIHPRIQREVSEALGHEVHLLLPEEERGRKQLSRLNIEEYKAAVNTLGKAEQDAARAAERAAGATKAAHAAERAQAAAEDRRRAAEAAAKASERARAQASDAAKAAKTEQLRAEKAQVTAESARKRATADAEAAKKSLEEQRRRAELLGPEGKGIDWHYPDGHVEHESSVGEVRAARDAEERLRSVAEKRRDAAEADAVSAENAAAMARADAEAWQAMVRDVQGISYKDEDGHERMGIRGMEQAYVAAQERLKAAQAAETAAVQQAQKAREDARAWRDKADLQQRRMGVRPMHLASALREICRQMADVCLDLWTYARDAARRAWDRWAGEGLGKCADAFGVSYMDALDVAYDELEDRAYAHGMGRAAVDDLTRGPGDEQDYGSRQQDMQR